MQPSKHCSDCKELKPLGDFHVRRASPDGLAYRCRECVNQFSVAWREKNPGAFKAWYAANKEDRAEYWQTWYSENREARAQKLFSVGKGQPRQEKRASRQAPCRAIKSHACMGRTSTLFRRSTLRLLALTKETGIRHEVDHIIPLQGKLICGFHHEDNLQILTRSENAHKRNKFAPEPLASIGT